MILKKKTIYKICQRKRKT